jgi:hypothetical protein
MLFPQRRPKGKNVSQRYRRIRGSGKGKRLNTKSQRTEPSLLIISRFSGDRGVILTLNAFAWLFSNPAGKEKRTTKRNQLENEGHCECIVTNLTKPVEKSKISMGCPSTGAMSKAQRIEANVMNCTFFLREYESGETALRATPKQVKWGRDTHKRALANV